MTLRVIEGEIVRALRRLNQLAAKGPSPSPPPASDQDAILHLGEALHEIQQALAHSRRRQAPGGPEPHLGSEPGAKAL